MPELKLRPIRGRWVPQHNGKPWPAEGMTVEVDHYVRRRIADGDLVEVEDDQPADPIDPPAPEAPAADETPRAPRKTRKGDE